MRPTTDITGHAWKFWPNRYRVAKPKHGSHLPLDIMHKTNISVTLDSEAHPMRRSEINPQQWQHAQDIARQTCARIFRDGGSPADALDAFGLAHADAAQDWRHAVEAIADALSDQSTKLAA
ncbi:MAG: hypothetical protein ACR2PG_20400 [Hyphomicrobiaceae bacterium]